MTSPLPAAELMRDGSVQCPKCHSAALVSTRRYRDAFTLGLAFSRPRLRCMACGTVSRRPMDRR